MVKLKFNYTKLKLNKKTVLRVIVLAILIKLIAPVISGIFYKIKRNYRLNNAVVIQPSLKERAAANEKVQNTPAEEPRQPYADVDQARLKAIEEYKYYTKDLSGDVYYKGYYSGQEHYLGKMDLYTIVAIDRIFIKDKSQVYFIPFDGYDRIEEEIDALTFKKVGDKLYEDKNKKYTVRTPDSHTARTPTLYLVSAPFGEDFPKFPK